MTLGLHNTGKPLIDVNFLRISNYNFELLGRWIRLDKGPRTGHAEKFKLFISEEGIFIVKNNVCEL